jgi:uncharacterized OB-fold protein
MSTFSQPRIILKCKKCHVTFVPEQANQLKCNNCLIREEIEAKVKLRTNR